MSGNNGNNAGNLFGLLTAGVSTGGSPGMHQLGAPQNNGAGPNNGNGGAPQPNMGNAGVGNFNDQGLHNSATGSGGTGNGIQGGQGNAVVAPNKSPLDGFSTLFKLPTDAVDPMAEFDKPLFSLRTDSPEFAKAIGERDFSQVVPEDIIAKALQGDAGSFRQAINHALRAQFSTMSHFVQQMVEQGVKTYHGRSSAAMPHMFKDFAGKTALADSLPNANHAGVQPLMQGLQAQMQKAYPNDSPQQTAQRVRDYLMAVAQGITPASDPNARDPVTGKAMNGGAPQGNGMMAEDGDFSAFFR